MLFCSTNPFFSTNSRILNALMCFLSRACSSKSWDCVDATHSLGQLLCAYEFETINLISFCQHSFSMCLVGVSHILRFVHGVVRPCFVVAKPLEVFLVDINVVSVGVIRD